VTATAAPQVEGRGSGPSPRRVRPLWPTALGVALVAALVGLAVGRFVVYEDEAAVPLPTVVAPPEDEVRALQAAADAAPDDPEAWQQLGIAATRQAIATADPAWYAVAEDAIATAAELDPDDPLTLVAEGQLALSLHDFPRALEIGRRATEAAPRSADAWGVLVDASVELGDYEGAEVALQRMLDLRPDLPALARASYLRQLRGDLDGAIVAMRQADVAGGAGPTTGTGVTALLGDLLLHRGDLDEAQAAYVRSTTAPGAVGLARIATARGDTATALEILTDLADRLPTPPVVTALAEVQRRAGDEEGLAETVELARTLAVLQQDAGQVVDLELALFEASFGDPARAVELGRAAYDARPDNVYAAGALAWALHRAGDTARARELAAEATRLGTVDTPHELRMAEVLGRDPDDVLARNPLAQDLFLP
jgi:tetratricopeptide (TPR) repeat protein